MSYLYRRVSLNQKTTKSKLDSPNKQSLADTTVNHNKDNTTHLVIRVSEQSQPAAADYLNEAPGGGGGGPA